VDELVKRVTALEAQVQELRAEQQWTDLDARVFAQYKLWERAGSCNLTDCYLRDPVLRGFSDMPARFRAGFAILLATGGQWSAVHEPEYRRWRVEARVSDSKPRVFYAYERAGIVEAEVPSTE
jgi:hypothetical protein